MVGGGWEINDAQIHSTRESFSKCNVATDTMKNRGIWYVGFFFNAVWMLHKSRILCFILCIWNALEFQFIYPFVNWNPKTKLLLDSQLFLWFCKINPHTAYTIKCKTKQMVACTLLWRARDHGYFTRLVWETYKRLDELISCAGFQRT